LRAVARGDPRSILKGTLVRFALVLIVASALAAVVVPEAFALRFADAPCPEAGPGGIRVCPAARVGTSYAIKLDGEGGCGPDPNVPGSGLPYQFRVLSGALPPGLSLGKDGLISGVLTKAGIWTFWVELSDQDPPSASWCSPKRSEREFKVQVGAPAGEVGTPYALALGALGDAPETWSVASGQLPPGLTLDSASGTITGMATRPRTVRAVPADNRTTDALNPCREAESGRWRSGQGRWTMRRHLGAVGRGLSATTPKGGDTCATEPTASGSAGRESRVAFPADCDGAGG
jgi:hypothetical protein